jgi:hypothetical protein
MLYIVHPSAFFIPIKIRFLAVKCYLNFLYHCDLKWPNTIQFKSAGRNRTFLPLEIAGKAIVRVLKLFLFGI